MIGMRLCLPAVEGRGAGLGNELLPWARSFIAAQVLGARCLSPAFGLNRRGYRHHFGTPRWDWLAHRLLKATLPVVEFAESDYLEHGGGDVVGTLRRFAHARGLYEQRAFVLLTRGMWGGVGHVEAAREFVKSRLYTSRHAAGNLLQLRDRLDASRPVVGVHVRLGDFSAALAPHEYRGRFNLSLPLDWYRRVMASIHGQLGGAVQFLMVSDAGPERLQPLLQGFDCVTTGDLPNGDCSDLLALSRCDLIVCSVSSFSVWAAFLSASPYLWYGPNLHVHAEGFLSIWGHEAVQQRPGSPTRRAIEAMQGQAEEGGRGWPVGDDGRVPAPALPAAAPARGDWSSDLLHYGVVRAAATPPGDTPRPAASREGSACTS